MATHRIPIMGANTVPDISGEVYMAPISSMDTHTNVKNQLCMVMDYPQGAADSGFYGSFKVPKNYVGTPKIVVMGTFVGAPANTFAVGCQLVGLADSESIDTAYEAEDLANEGTWTGYADEDMFEISITMTVTLAADDTVFYWFFRDDSADNQTQAFLLTSLEFEYADA
jgi:hypothetical protein